MSKAIDTYLDRVMLYANRRDAEEADRIRGELRDHLLTKIEQLEAEGTLREDTVFQAIEEQGHPKIVGYGLRPPFPWIDIRSHGTARGVIAIGPRAVGVFACGGVAVGVAAFGGVACGLLGVGGVTLALLFAWAGIAVVPLGLAYGGIAVGLLVFGGIVAGVWQPTGASMQGLIWLGERPEWLAFADLPFRSSAGFVTFLSLGIVLQMLAVAAVIWLHHRERRRLVGSDAGLVD